MIFSKTFRKQSLGVGLEMIGGERYEILQIMLGFCFFRYCQEVHSLLTI